MMRLEPRIKKLEDRALQNIPCPRIVVIGVPPCADKHITGATVDDRFLQRLRGESLEALRERAAATVTGDLVIVSLKSPCYDSGGSKCHDINGVECHGPRLVSRRGGIE